MDSPESLVTSLRKRKLVQWAAGYAAAAWVLLQVLALVGQQFDWPAALMRGITVTLGIGFFLTVVLAWFHGERGEQRVTWGELAVLGLILVLGGAALWWTAPVPREKASVAAAPVQEAAPAPAPVAAPPKKSIAVLPFTDLSPGKDQEYFSDGMSEEILNALAKVKDLKVAGRTSAFSFKGKNEDMRAIGRALAVANVLEGSVRKQGDKVRITAQLIQAEDGYHLWSETYDGDLKDVFELQERIARAITEQLKIVLEGAQQQRLVKVATENQEAYALYLQATGIFNRRDGTRIKDAVAQLEKAIELDPNFARAHSRLAAVLAIARIYAEVGSVAEVERHARRATELDPNLGEAHAALAQALVRERRYAEGLAGFERALAVDPDDVTANFWYGINLVIIGYGRKGNAQLDRLLTLDPMLPNGLFWRATQYCYAGDYANCKRLIQRAADAGLAYVGAGQAEVARHEGRLDDAVRLMAKGLPGLDLRLTEADARILANGIYGDAAARTRALEWIDAAIAKKPERFPYVVLRVLPLMGESKRALALSAENATVNEASYVPLFWSDYGKPARTSPEFAEYARKTGLAEAWERFGEPDLCKRRAPGDYVCR